MALCQLAVCQASSEVEEVQHNRASVEAAMCTSVDTWRAEVSYHYMFLPYIGVGTSLGMWKQWDTDWVPAGKGWYADHDDEKITNYYLCPSLHLETPALLKLGKTSLRIYAEPGCMLNFPYERVCIRQSKGGMDYDYKHVSGHADSWAAFNVKLGIALKISDGAGFAAGYNYSSHDIYANRRGMKYDNQRFSDFYPEKKGMHEVFISTFFFF